MVDVSTAGVLVELSELIRRKNAVDTEIAAIVGRPALMGHVGEYIAAKVFDIRLEYSATSKAIDGYFETGPLAGRSVNVKWYGKLENLLDIRPDVQPDYFLVMTGPQGAAATSRGGVRPWVIKHVFLFESQTLLAALRLTGAKVGIAASVRTHLWKAASIYPEANNPALVLDDEQRRRLAAFG